MRGARPRRRPGQVVVEVAAAGVNRADLHAAAGALPAAARARRTARGSSARAPSPRSATGVEPAGRSATGSARCSTAAGTPSGSPCRAGQLLPVPDGTSPGRRRRAARGGLHGLVERLPHRRAAAGRDAARARRVERHRHDGRSSSRPAAGRASLVTAGSAEKRRAAASSSGRTWSIDYRGDDFVERVREADRRPRCRRRARHHGRPLPGPQRRGARHRRPARRHRPAGRAEGRARPRRHDAQAGLGARRTSLRARPSAEKAEVVRQVREPGVAAGRRRRGPPRRRPACSRWPTRPRAPGAGGRRARREGAPAVV